MIRILWATIILMLLPSGLCVDQQPLISNNDLAPQVHNYNIMTSLAGTTFELSPMSVNEWANFFIWTMGEQTVNYEYTTGKFQCLEFCAQFLRDAYNAGFTHGLYLINIEDCSKYPGGHFVIAVSSINGMNGRPGMQIIDPQNGVTMNQDLFNDGVDEQIILMVPEYVTITDATHVTCDPHYETTPVTV